MADPFEAISSGFGSFVDFINNSRDNAMLYRRYGPNYRNIMDDRQRRTEMQALNDIENLRKSRASAMSADLSLEVDRFNANEAIYKTSQMLGSHPDGTPVSPDDKRYIPEKVGGGGGDLIPMAAVRGAEAQKREEEEGMIGRVREADKFAGDMRFLESRIATEDARRQNAMASAGASNARAESAMALADKRNERGGGGLPGLSGSKGSDASQGPPKLSAGERQDLALGFANEFLANSGEKGAVTNAQGYEIEIDGVSSKYRDMRDVPASLQKQSVKAVDEYLKERRSPGGGADEGFTVKVPSKDGRTSTGRVFKSREDPAAQQIEKGIASKLDGDGKLREGEELTPEELAYLQAVRSR